MKLSTKTSKEWEFSGEEILKQLNTADFGEYGFFTATKIRKEPDAHGYFIADGNLENGEKKGKAKVLFLLAEEKEFSSEATAGEIWNSEWFDFELEEVAQ